MKRDVVQRDVMMREMMNRDFSCFTTFHVPQPHVSPYHVAQ